MTFYARTSLYTAHHHPIAHILRFRRQLWTYDENGVLQIWFEPHPQAHQDEDAYRPDIISLEGRPKTLRIATKQTFAIVVGAQLWSARERIIEVAAPMESASTFKRRVEVPGNYAAISCMAVCEALVPSVARPDAPTQYPDALHDPALYRVYVESGFSESRVSLLFTLKPPPTDLPAISMAKLLNGTQLTL